MNTIVKISLAMAFWLTSSVAAQAQAPSRLNDKEVESLLKRLEENADRFRSSFDQALKKSRLNGTKDKDRAKQYVKDFEDATDHLKDRFSKNNSAAGDVEEVLRRAAKIDDLMEQDILDSRAQNDWRSVRNSLDELARAYNVSWRWSRRAYGASPIRHEDMRSLVDRIERDSHRFHESLNDALDRGHFDDTRSDDDRIRQFVGDFEAAIDRLKDHFSTNDSATGDIEEVLHRGERINRFMIRNSLDARAQEDWRMLRRDVDELARV
jgi:DNA repair exonuclease SbcCD ATPase subunit